MSTDDPRTTGSHDREFPEPDQEPPGPRDRRPDGGLTFWPLLDVSAGLILAGWIVVVVTLAYGAPPVERVPDQDLALALIVGTSMDLEAALEAVPDWERGLYGPMLGDEGGLSESITWYRELLAHRGDPVVWLHLAILEGEAGLLERTERHRQPWTGGDEAVPPHRHLIEAAYFGSHLDPLALSRLHSEVADALAAGWFRDRLALRLAERAGNEALREATLQGAQERQAVLLSRTRAFLAAEAAVVVSGLLVLVLWFMPRRRNPTTTRVGPATLPPPWPGRTGLLVLLRGAAAGVAVMIGFILTGAGPITMRLFMVPLINAPLLWLASRHLLRPHRLGFQNGLGLRPAPGGTTTLVLAIPVLSAAGLLVDWAVVLFARPLDLSLHWADWFDADLVWGQGVPLGAALVEYLLFAPVFEEIVFRGILFGTLRRRFSFGVAALLSATLFAGAHGYGLLGLVSVCASGVIWAWAYERTGSLLPGMIAHCLNNLLVCAGMMAMLR